MIPIMKVTTKGQIKGQISIPQKIRERFHLLPGTNVEFLPQGDAAVIRPAEGEPEMRFPRWLKNAQGSATAGLTTDEIMATTRGED